MEQGPGRQAGVPVQVLVALLQALHFFLQLRGVLCCLMKLLQLLLNLLEICSRVLYKQSRRHCNDFAYYQKSLFNKQIRYK